MSTGTVVVLPLQRQSPVRRWRARADSLGAALQRRLRQQRRKSHIVEEVKVDRGEERHDGEGKSFGRRANDD